MVGHQLFVFLFLFLFLFFVFVFSKGGDYQPGQEADPLKYYREAGRDFYYEPFH
jgi:hypothetical protein